MDETLWIADLGSLNIDHLPGPGHKLFYIFSTEDSVLYKTVRATRNSVSCSNHFEKQGWYEW